MSALTRGSLAQRVRLISGLVLFVFAALHFSNTAVALFDLKATQAFADWRYAINRSIIGTTILGGALLAHAGLALAKLASRRTLRLPLWEWVQLALGMAIPILLLPHIVNTHVASAAFHVFDGYGYELARLWPDKAVNQSALLLIVWVHGCIGLHFWLRLDAWYRRIAPLMLVLATALPLAAIAGFIAGGREVAALMADSARAAELKAAWHWPDAAEDRQLAAWREQAVQIYLGLLGVIVAIVALRQLRRLLSPRVSIAYVGGPVIAAPIGPTLLEISRSRGVPHASVCGGRARCSTCRVRVAAGAEALEPPNQAERRTLAAINAPPDVRLACQLRIADPATVIRLVPVGPQIDTATRRHSADSDGVERSLAILFFDLRGFTKASQGRLPYDVVFTLNRLFAEVGAAIEAEQGWIDKYMGDGLMAVFGRDSGREEGCRQALRAASAAAKAMDRLGAEAGADPSAGTADDPLHGRFAYAMGLHVGPLVLGRIGHARSARITVIGEPVNVASRLEAEAKARDLGLIVSREVLHRAGVDPDAPPSGLVPETLSLRGLDAPIDAVLAPEPAQIEWRFHESVTVGVAPKTSN